MKSHLTITAKPETIEELKQTFLKHDLYNKGCEIKFDGPNTTIYFENCNMLFLLIYETGRRIERQQMRDFLKRYLELPL